MRRLSVFLLSILFICAANASNPFMGDAENQFAFYLAQGFDNGYIVPLPYHPVPFYIAQIQYSQPTTFFRLPARQSLNFGETAGFGKMHGWDWRDLTTPISMISGDVALLYGEKWYAGLGAGAGLQARQNDRLGAKLLFQFKMFYGYRINDHWGIEIYGQHFSNANTARQNYSYAFYGIGVNYNF
ncbi:MAG: acyloxyacyl hydrolase [Alphaproteobacteria bacterium]|nr:acyloxyacyl hydrolase [Alphaproteobacteria bacterium]